MSRRPARKPAQRRGAGRKSIALDPAPEQDAVWRRQVAHDLGAWFAHAQRDLPWRRTRDLYSIWISEVMLQQTQVATVIPYYERFLARFPTPQALAEADEAEVLRLWEGLGYYRRARQLHAAAQQIAREHSGRFPDDYEAVRNLPGVGRYTAGAVLSIGAGQRLPILEANSIRVFARLCGYRGSVTDAAGQARLWAIAEALVPESAPGMFNQAVMELGGAVCTPKAPACVVCPLQAYCCARAAGATALIPTPKPQPRFESVVEAAAVIRVRGRVLLRQCGAGERWAGLWDFPRFRLACTAADSPAVATELGAQLRSAGVPAELGERLAVLRHGVTRFRITLAVFSATMQRAVKGYGQWFTPEELSAAPLNVTARKIAQLVQGPSHP